MKTARWIGGFLAGAAVLFAGCGGGGGGPSEPSVSHLILSLEGPLTVATGTRLTLVADAVYTDGRIARVSPSWATTSDIGTIDSQGVFTAGSSPASGAVLATYRSVSASLFVSVVPRGSLSDARVEAASTILPSAIIVNTTVPFYVTAVSGGNRMHVGADPGSWAVTGGIGTIDAQMGLFNAGAVGTGSVSARVDGLDATPLAIRVVQTVNIAGAVRNARTMAGIPNVAVAFLYPDRTEAARLVTRSDGSFRGPVPTSATMLYVVSAPPAFFDIFRYRGELFWVDRPASCAAPITPPTEGANYGSIFLFSTSDPPPPPPRCD